MATVAVAGSDVAFAYERPALRVALETAAALVGSVVAYLAFGRFRRSAERADLVLACALALLAGANLFLGALPGALEQEWRAATWASVGAHTAGTLVLAVAAVAPRHRVRRPARTAVIVLVGAAVGFAALVAMLAAWSSRLPPGVERTGGELASHPLVLAAHVLGVVAFAAAGVGFLRRSERVGDSFLAWVAAGALLAAFARLHYALYPSLYSRWLHTGDVFRLLFYGVLLGGAAREIGGYWRRVADAAVLEERRRLARDLHDGVAQELAYIVRRARRLGREHPDAAEPIATAAERALDDSRRAIAALTRPVDESLDVALAEATQDVAARTGLPIELELAPDVEVRPTVREALVRIACEAVGNSARHAGASRVRVELTRGRQLRLRITDDGRGFDAAGVERSRRGGFGLTSMRERADGIGAEFALRSQAGRGTEVEVTWP